MENSNKFNKTLFFTATLVIGGFIFITIIEKVGLEKIIKTVLVFQPRHFLILTILSAISVFISALRWKIILESSGIFVSFKKVFMAKMIGNSINYLTPSGLVIGEPFKAMILSGKTGLSLGTTMTSIVIEGFLFLSVFLVFIIIGIFAFFSYSDVSLKILAVIAVAIIFLLTLFYLFFAKMINHRASQNEKGFFTYLIDLLHLHKFSFINGLKSKIVRRENEIKSFFRFHKKTVFTAVTLSILEITITLATSWLTLYFLGLTASIKTLLGLFSLMSISYLIPLPGSLGGLELSQIFAFGFFNLGGQAAALAFALITRLISLFFVAVGIGFLIHFEINIISKKISSISLKLNQKIRGFLKSL